LIKNTHTDEQPQLSDTIFIYSSTVTEWKAHDCGISKAAKDPSLSSKINQVSQETGSETNIAFFGRALMPSDLGMHTGSIGLQ